MGVRACGAKLERFAHNDLDDLERRLQQRQGSRCVVLSESLFSMEGSSPDVGALAALCQRHSAPLLLDEAHALGVLGPGGRGLGHGLDGVSLLCGTFGKAFASGGAFLACGEALGEELLQTSGAFRYTTALAPPLAAAAAAALQLIASAEGDQRRQQLKQHAQRWRDSLASAGWPRPAGVGPIVAVKLGDDGLALDAAAALEDQGVLVVAIRPPTVPEGEAMLRFSLRPHVPEDALIRVLETLEAFKRR